MTEDKEIREAIKVCYGVRLRASRISDTEMGDNVVKALETLLALAERYLQVQGMPEKTTCNSTYTHCDCIASDIAEDGGYDCIKVLELRNRAIDDCRLAYTKQMTERLEGLEDVLIKAEEEYADSFEKGKLLAPTRVHYLATVVRNHIANVSKKVGEDK